MDHVAILSKSWGLLPKILSGRKTIESRWYQTKRPPWNSVEKGDTVYFKESGMLVTGKASVSKVVQIQDLTSDKVRTLLKKYGVQIGIDKEEVSKYFKLFKDKRYCILIFIRNPRKVKPFGIDKTGFGMQSGWITLKSVEYIRI